MLISCTNVGPSCETLLLTIISENSLNLGFLHTHRNAVTELNNMPAITISEPSLANIIYGARDHTRVPQSWHRYYKIFREGASKIHLRILWCWELTAWINFGAGRRALLQDFGVYSPSSGTRLRILCIDHRYIVHSIDVIIKELYWVSYSWAISPSLCGTPRWRTWSWRSWWTAP